MTDTSHVSLSDEIDRLEARIEELQAADVELREAFDPSDDDVDADADAVEDTVRDWGGGGFEVKALDVEELSLAEASGE